MITKKIFFITLILIGLLGITKISLATYQTPYTIDNFEEYSIGTLDNQEEWEWCGPTDDDINVVAGSLFEGTKGILGNNGGNNVDIHYKNYSPYFLGGTEEIFNFYITFEPIIGGTTSPGTGQELLQGLRLSATSFCINNEAEGINLDFISEYSTDTVDVYRFSSPTPGRTYTYIGSFPVGEWVPISIYYNLATQLLGIRINWQDTVWEYTADFGTNTLSILDIIPAQRNQDWYIDYIQTGAFDSSATGSEYLDCNSLNCGYCSNKTTCEFVGCEWNIIYVTNPPSGICTETRENLGLDDSSYCQNYYASNSNYTSTTKFYDWACSSTDPLLGNTLKWFKKFQNKFSITSSAAFGSSVGSIVPTIRGYLLFVDNIIGYQVSLFLLIYILILLAFFIINFAKGWI